MQKWHHTSIQCLHFKGNCFICFAIFKYQLQFYCHQWWASGGLVTFCFSSPFILFLWKQLLEIGGWRLKLSVCSARWEKAFRLIYCCLHSCPWGHRKSAASQFKKTVCLGDSYRIFIWLSCLFKQKLYTKMLCHVFTKDYILGCVFVVNVLLNVILSCCAH